MQCAALHTKLFSMGMPYHSHNPLLPLSPRGNFPGDVLEEETALKEISQAH